MQSKSNTSDAASQPGAAESIGAKSDRRKRSIPVATDRRHQDPAPVERVESAPVDAPSVDRRKRDIPAAIDSRKHDHVESPAPVLENDEETAFKTAMDRYKRENRRPFPTWSEVLEVLRSLGYRKVAEESGLPGVKKDSEASSTKE